MKKNTFQLSLAAAAFISIYGCNSDALRSSAGGALLGASEQIAAPNLVRPQIDLVKTKAAFDAFVAKNKSKYGAIPFCLPASGDKYFFFVCKGEFAYSSPYTAGIVDANGKTIVPMEMSKIGNLGATIDGYWEVSKNGKVGMYDASGNLAIPIEMDAIYPYKGGSEVLAQVRRGAAFGWADRKGGVHFETNSSSDANLFKAPSFQTISSLWSYKLDNQSLHYFLPPYEEVEYGTSGTVFTPSYLAQLAIIPDFQTEITVGGIDISTGINDYSASISQLRELDNGNKGFLATVMEAGVSGRDYHYDSEVLVTTNKNLEKVSQLSFTEPETYVCGTELVVRFLSNSLVEVKKIDNAPEAANYGQMTQYAYYSISPDASLTELKTNRIFSFTKHQKIDESYFAGCFSRGIDEAIDKGYSDEHNMVTTAHLSIEDLDIMRNEIFAEYGYKFTTDKWKKYFAQQSWYKPQYDNVDAMLSETEKANIQVILKMKEKLQKGEAAYIKKEYVTYVAAG